MSEKKDPTSEDSPSLLEDLQIEDQNVFKITDKGPDFRGLTCFGAAALVVKTQFGLGILGLPHTFYILGVIPGLISLITLCILTTWSGVVVGHFRLRHPHTYSIGDAAEILFGPAGREFMGAAFWLFYTLAYGATVLTVSIAFNAITSHAACTTVWTAVGAIISLILGTATRTLKVMSWMGVAAIVSLFVSVWIVAIACLTQDTPSAAPKNEAIEKGIAAVATGKSYAAVASAVATQLAGLSGTASFFTIHTEMRDQRQYNKALYLGQGFVAFNYIIITCIVYAKVGKYVTSPALGSAGPLIKKICYGIALPGLIFSCFFLAHLAGKYCLVRILRGTRHLQMNTPTHWTTWISMMLLAIVFGFVIASAIPFFGDLVALIAALFGTTFSLIIPGFIAVYNLGSNVKREGDGTLWWFSGCIKAWKKNRWSVINTLTAALSVSLGAYILVTGTYGSVQSIIDGYRNGTVSHAFACEDNSG
ncbi:hypothetical protein ACI3LY_001463 [Candidozyma auris]|uniref:Amino acid transporter transmembrane domain-containing protein n=2 Tax=Candidozyma auris TaxID=498019 RepID=A0ABF7SXS1_CANAR|nr:hypothetical protein QG37_03400 [[Candida] auris]PIS55442.1 hypothetical protein B9J08_001541 [[Candida] auris]PIS56515.1 hypothetical protein CJI97_001768 [[Candida] auris]PSK76061.1 hypothetical protein CJJ07_004134 [[Candida] auris]QWW22893.1 hypothetical protein CA7LBN_001640 [[Candida] auris]